LKGIGEDGLGWERRVTGGEGREGILNEIRDVTDSTTIFFTYIYKVFCDIFYFTIVIFPFYKIVMVY
jgi:hypothetical protein